MEVNGYLNYKTSVKYLIKIAETNYSQDKRYLSKVPGRRKFWCI